MDDVSGDQQKWPTHCPECGTELQSGQIAFEASDFSGDGKMGTPISQDFCPNPDCPAHDPAAARAAGVAEPETLPGSLGGDNGGG